MENLKYKFVSDNILNFAIENSENVEINFLSVTLWKTKIKKAL